MATSTWKSRRTRLVLAGAVVVAGAGLAYSAYTSEAVQSCRRAVRRYYLATQQYYGAFLAGADIGATLLRDIQLFLASDREDVPLSIQQLARLAQSKEVQNITSSLVSASIKGAFMSASEATAHAATNGNKAAAAAHAKTSSGPALPAVERVLGALLSKRGTTLVTLAVGMACRASTSAYCEYMERQAAADAQAGRPDLAQRVLEWLATPDGERLATACAGAFARSGTAAYLAALEGVNMWQDMLGALAVPRHAAVVEQWTRAAVHEGVSGLLRPGRTRQGEAGHTAYGSTGSVSNQANGSCGKALVCTDSTQASKICGAGAGSSKNSRGGAAAGRDRLHPMQLSAAPITGLADIGKATSVCLSGLAAATIKVARVPEARALLASLTATVVAEGVRTGLFSMRDLVLGPRWGEEAGPGCDKPGLLTLSHRRAYALVVVALSIVMYISSRHLGGLIGNGPVVVLH